MQISPFTGKSLEAIRLTTARTNVYEGSVRSGKTIASIVAWLRYVRTAPAGNLLMAGKTERTLKRNVIDPMVEMLGSKRCRLIAGSGELWLLGRRIYIAGANDERAQEKIRGLTLLGAYVDEASTAPESFWSMLLTRLSDDDARLIATTNPDNPRHWLKRDYLDRASTWLTDSGTQHPQNQQPSLDLHRFSFRLTDNPHLSRSYIESLEREFVGLWRRRYILGEWVAAESAIYDMWDENKHVVDELPAISRWIGVGVDYGTTNPFHAVLLAAGVDGRLYITNEYRHDSRQAHRQLTDVEYSKRLQTWLQDLNVNPHWTVVDPSATSFRVQLYRDGITPALADNSVLDGIRLVSSLIADGTLKIHRSCTGLIDEITGYSWDADKANRGEDTPIKANDHGMDALRYVIKTTEAAWRPLIKQQGKASGF